MLTLTFSFVRVHQLRENSNYFRQRLKDMGFRVLGDKDSPIIPLMLYHPAKIVGFSRLCLEEKVFLHPLLFSQKESEGLMFLLFCTDCCSGCGLSCYVAVNL